MVPQKENDKEKAIALGATGTGVGATIIKKTYDKGNLTGRETLFHGTSKERAKKIKETGLLSKFTGRERGNTEILKKLNKALCGGGSRQALVWFYRQKTKAVSRRMDIVCGQPKERSTTTSA